MDLSLNDTQQLIQDSARDFVRGACDRDVLLKLDRNPAGVMEGIWQQMSELGWTGMAIPEEYGGTGNSMTDVAVLFEELGTGPVPGPLFSSAVLCARILLEAADESDEEGVAAADRERRARLRAGADRRAIRLVAGERSGSQRSATARTSC